MLVGAETRSVPPVAVMVILPRSTRVPVASPPDTPIVPPPRPTVTAPRVWVAAIPALPTTSKLPPARVGAPVLARIVGTAVSVEVALPVAEVLRVKLVPLPMEATVEPGTILAPLMAVPTTNPAVPPAKIVSPLPLAVAGAVIVKVVALSLLTTEAPTGIPVPLTPMPTLRAAVLVTVTEVEPTVVCPAVKVFCAEVVTAVPTMVPAPVSENGMILLKFRAIPPPLITVAPV